MSSLDATIVATALHSLERGLHTSINWASWAITAYSVGLVLMLSVAGALGERYGQRRVFLASVIVFTGASLGCGLATNIYVLIALRALQAVGGAGFTPSGTGLVVEHFGAGRDKAVGLFGAIFSIGSIVGPVLGGLLVAYWSWRGIFFVNVPIGALLVVLCLHYVPRDSGRENERRRKLDLRGLAMLGVGVTALTLGISYLGEKSAKIWSPLFLIPVLVALPMLGGFVRHIRRVPNPFIAPRFIAGRGFAAVNVINVLYGAVYGLTSLVPLYAVIRYGISVLGSGTVLTAQAAAGIVLSIVAAAVLRRTGYRQPLYVGSVVVAVGMIALAFSPSGFSHYAWLAITTCLVGIGVGWSSPASRNACLQLAPESSSSLAALRSTGLSVGSIASISITTAILAQVARPGIVQAYVFAVAGVIVVMCMPVIARIPEHRGSW